MVVVLVSSDAPPGVGGCKPAVMNHYSSSQYVIYPGDDEQFCDGHNVNVKDCDSDEGSDHSSGRGSGTDCASDVDR